jgi:hydroxymethylpyrimidine pyrophosphatase-like HAD family hydrolase
MPSPAKISLVVTDLDGTLWHTDDRIDPDVVTAARDVERLGVPLLVATGRRLASTRAPLRRVGMAPPAVVLNGALGVDLGTGERFHCSPFPPEQAVAVLAAFRRAGLDPVVHVDHQRYDVFLGPTPSTHPEHVAALGDTAGADDLDSVTRQERVLGFSLIGVQHRAGVAVVDAIGELAESHLDRSLDHAGAVTLTVAPRGQSKWDGVLAFCELHRLDPSRVLAVADGPNDIELLDNAYLRLVPKVAHPAALSRADHVIPAAADGGWTAVLDHLR